MRQGTGPPLSWETTTPTLPEGGPEVAADKSRAAWREIASLFPPDRELTSGSIQLKAVRSERAPFC